MMTDNIGDQSAVPKGGDDAAFEPSAEPSAELSIESTDQPSVGAILAAIGLAAIYAAMLVPLLLFVLSLMGRYFYLCELIGNFRAYILAALIPCGLILWFTAKRKRSLFFFAAGIWSCFGVVTPAFWYQQPAGGNDVVKIMSFNVLGINNQFESVIGRIKEHDPDVVTILEYANQWSTALEKLNDDYPYRLLQPRWHGFGIAIFSKRPFLNSSTMLITPDVTDNPLVAAEIEIDGAAVRLVGVHLLSPMNRARLRIRNRQLEEVADLVNQRDVPTIVMGDFNCTPWSPFLADFLKETELRDSRYGFGYQASWCAEKPYFRIPIDHGFVSSEIKVHSRQLGRPAGSDHYPLVFEVSLTPK